VDRTALLCAVKNAVVFDCLHLNARSTPAPILFFYLLGRKAKAGNHTGLILSIKRNSAFALAAKAAAGARKNIGYTGLLGWV
jgi:hypothetical protein